MSDETVAVVLSMKTSISVTESLQAVSQAVNHTIQFLHRTEVGGCRRISQLLLYFTEIFIVIQLSPFKQELKMAVNVYTLISLGLVTSSPIIDPYQSQRNQFGSGLPKGFCFLPSELGQGKAVLVEDCNNLGEDNCDNYYYDLICVIFS